MKTDRRYFLRGVGGAVLGLPVLESLAPRTAFAQEETALPYAIFFRQANGVSQEWGNEDPERFFPRSFGTLTPESMNGRAVDELVDFRSKLLIVRDVNMQAFDYGDGHAWGALQGLTARGPTQNGQGGSSEANGESIDFRIGRELNPQGRDPLYLYAGQPSGWLGGPCISYRGPGQKRDPLNNPWNAYQQFVSGDSDLDDEAQQRLRVRQESVNDLVRAQMQRLLNRTSLSTDDRQRLQLHFESVRELEVSLACRMAEDEERALEDLAPGFNSTNGDETLETARLHMQVAALAVACGYTRAVAIQVGSGNDGSTRYRNPETNSLMENFHYISHRRLSHGADGEIIPNADLLHHYVDRQFAQTFRYLLERLDAYALPNGRTLLEQGIAAWYNDNGHGPAHSIFNIPWVLAGSCDGYFKQGEMVLIDEGGDANHSRLLNTIGTAVGVRKANGDILDDFGDPSFPRGVLNVLRA